MLPHCEVAVQVPDVCATEFKQRVAENFALPQQPYPANESLMEGQSHLYGGVATRPPPQLPRSYPSTPVIQLNPLQAPALPSADAATTFALLRPFSLPHQATV